MKSLLSAIVALFGAVCMAIAMAHILLGQQVIPGSVPTNATMDSEDRFYSALFLGFGAALIWTSRNLATRRGELNALLATFWLGGIARLFSWAAMGPPNKLFILLGAVELTLPILLWVWRNSAHPSSGSQNSP